MSLRLAFLAVGILSCAVIRSSLAQPNVTTPQSPLPKPESDFSAHPNFHLLPPLKQCGYSFANKFSKVPSASESSSMNMNTITIDDDGSTRRKRVVGGVPAEFGKNPWMVGIIQKNLTTTDIYPICGGTIINNHTILTAAHCVTDVDAGAAITHVLLGAYRDKIFDDLRMFVNEMPMEVCTPDESGAQVCSTMYLAEIEEIVVHENYSTGGYRNDLALIKIRKSIWSFNTSFHYDANSENKDLRTTGMQEALQLIRPICLPRQRELLNGLLNKKFELVGWGYLSQYPTIVPSPALNRVKLRLMPNEYCSEMRALPTGQNQLCMLGEPGMGACPGDSGSPLLKAFPVTELGDKSQVFQVGIVSSFINGAFDCGSQGLPTWFTNVMEFMPWILDNL